MYVFACILSGAFDVVLYTMSRTKRPNLVIFGRDVAERVCYQCKNFEKRLIFDKVWYQL